MELVYHIKHTGKNAMLIASAGQTNHSPHILSDFHQRADRLSGKFYPKNSDIPRATPSVT